MQYTIRGVPKALDRALRERAAREHKSLTQVALAALEQGLGLHDGPAVKLRDLSDLAGRWVKDRAVERALDDQRSIDDELWK